MNSISDIRGLLQVRAAGATGFPASNQIKYEGLLFTPTRGVPWARMTLLPSSKRPFALKGDSQVDAGLFQVDLIFPTKVGTKTIEDALDAVIARFVPGQTLFSSTASVWINYAERGPLQETADDLTGIVRVSWRIHSSS